MSFPNHFIPFFQMQKNVFHWDSCVVGISRDEWGQTVQSYSKNTRRSNSNGVHLGPNQSRHFQRSFQTFLPGFSHIINTWLQEETTKMYCLQWLLPLLLIPRPMNPFMLNNYSMFMTLYLASFFLERRPCTICTVVFVAAVFLICYSGLGNCLFFSECST